MKISHEFINFDTNNAYFEFPVDETQLTKYLKLAYKNNKPRFKDRFINYYKTAFKAYNYEYFNYLLDNMSELWDKIKEFSYEEAFQIKQNEFRIKVFSVINVEEMIENLGCERIKTEGKETVNKVWNETLEKFEEIPLTLVYELHHVNGEKLGIKDAILPIIKCWCTSTDNEHWLWVDPDKIVDNSPLSGIVSTCCIYKSMVGKIKHIIRHGDVFIFEMLEEVVPSENDEVISLSVEEYFKLLKSQS